MSSVVEEFEAEVRRVLKLDPSRAKYEYEFEPKGYMERHTLTFLSPTIEVSLWTSLNKPYWGIKDTVLPDDIRGEGYTLVQAVERYMYTVNQIHRFD